MIGWRKTCWHCERSWRRVRRRRAAAKVIRGFPLPSCISLRMAQPFLHLTLPPLTALEKDIVVVKKEVERLRLTVARLGKVASFVFLRVFANHFVGCCCSVCIKSVTWRILCGEGGGLFCCCSMASKSSELLTVSFVSVIGAQQWRRRRQRSSPSHGQHGRSEQAGGGD